MLRIDKLSVGIRFAKRRFALNSNWGAVTDALGEEQKIELITTGVPGALEGYFVRLADRGITVKISADNVVMVQNSYNGTKGVDAEAFLKQFESTWTTINRAVKVQNFRRVGIVAEHRVSNSPEPSRLLAEKLITQAVEGFQAGFRLHTEQRIPITGSSRPNIKSDAFVNVITDLYDSESDEEPAPDAYNANLDIQRYFDPPLQGGVADEAKRLYNKEFVNRWRRWKEQLDALGLLPKHE